MKGINGEELKASSQILEVLKLVHDGDEETANKALQSLLQVISVSNDDNGAKAKGGNTANLLIPLVEEKTILSFKDQYGEPNLMIKVVNHAEIMQIQSRKVEYYISKLLFGFFKDSEFV
jgi:hypothetical protein